MKIIPVAIVFLLLVIILPMNIHAQDPSRSNPGRTIPEILLRPLYGEAPRFPRDMVIGELGQGTAPSDAWGFAQNFLNALTIRNIESPVFKDINENKLEGYFNTLDTINPARYHIGGGRIEPDGSVSFLVRFIGREQWIVGELYLFPDGNGWGFDDFMLEEARNLEDAINPYPFDFTPFERFF